MHSIQAITFDFYNTLAHQRRLEGRGDLRQVKPRLRAAISLLLILPAILSAETDITFTRDHVGDDSLSGGYIITAPQYAVHLQADGCLYHWKSGPTILTGREPLGYDTPNGQRDLRIIDDRTVLATDGDRTAVYRFYPDRISVRLCASPQGLEFFTEAPFRLHLPRSAQAVSDSYFGKPEALPTHQYWPNFDVLYDTGDSVQVFIGNDLPAPDLENFELSGRVWTLRVPADAQWHTVELYLKRSARQSRQSAAPHFSIQCDNPHRLFFDGEPPTFTLAFSGEEALTDLLDARLHYRVLDYWGDQVHGEERLVSLRAGREKQIDLELPAAPRGWMLLEVTLDGEAPGVEIIPRTIRTNYAVYRETPELARLEEERTIAEANGETYAWTWERTYFALGARMRRVPFLVSMAKNEPVEAEFDWDGSDKAMGQQRLDSQQYGLTHFTQIEGAAPWAMDPRDDPNKRLPTLENLTNYRAYCEALAKRYRKEMSIWEVFNEPNVYRITPEEYYERLLVPSWEGIKAGNADARIIGGTVCGAKLPYYDKLYQLGAAKYTDAWGLHPYCPGDWEEEGIGDFFENFKRLMVLYGDEKPLWVTEVGYMFTNAREPYWGKDRLPYGQQPPYGPLRNPRSELITKSFLVAEKHGIPREQFYYYYYPVHGFQPMYVMKRDGSFLPAGIAVLVLHDQLRDARFVRALPMPQRGVAAALFEADDRKVVAAWTFSFPLEASFRTDAKMVRVVSMMGVSTEATPENGVLSVKLCGAPSYFTLPRDAEIEDAGCSLWSENLVSDAEVTASSNADRAKSLVDGLLNDHQRPLADLREGKDGPPFAWQDATPGEFPDWVELTFPSPRRLNTVMVYSRSYGTLRDFDIEYQTPDNEEWKTAASVRDNVVQWCHHLHFPAIEAEKLRVNVLYANSGLMQSHPLLCGHKQNTLIREVEAYLVTEQQPGEMASPEPRPRGRWFAIAFAVGLMALCFVAIMRLVRGLWPER